MRKFGFCFKCSLNKSGTIEQVEYDNHFVPKFQDDKLYDETDDYIVILDGVILNKKELLKDFHQERWLDTVIVMYQQSGDEFFNALRGSFAGVLFDKKSQKVIVFTDHIGSKFLFYTQVGDMFFLSTLMDDVYKFRIDNHAKNDLSVENAYLLLSYGFMIDNRTLCEDIKKIKPGCYLKIEKGHIEEKQFYLLVNKPDYSFSEKEWVERIDVEFRKAVMQQFEKDKEYGYKHLVALSAGLDSRMTCWVAHDLGYTDQLNFTFSQSNYLDETVPKKITSDLRHEWIYKSLDNGLWLYNLEEITKLTGGNVLYYGLSHAYSMYSKLNFEEYGLIHTGMLGDVVLGTFYKTYDVNAQFKLGDGAYSKSLIDRIDGVEYSKYDNQEISNFYFRGFAGANNGNMSEYLFTEGYSPFYNLEFLQFALSIPLELRYNHYIYKKWIIEKYPKAADYIWENIGCKITRSFGMIKKGGKSYRIETIPEKAIRKFFPKLLKPNTQSMNPLAFYLTSNSDLNDYLQSYITFVDKINDNELRNDVLKLNGSINGIERIQATSLLAAIKIYY